MKALALAAFLAAVSCTTNQTLKFNVSRKLSNKAQRPPRIVHTNETELVFTLANEFQAFLSGLTRASSIEVNVDNFYEVYYAADIYLGSKKVAFDVTLDTGSNMLVIQDTSCTACQTTFNQA